MYRYQALLQTIEYGGFSSADSNRHFNISLDRHYLT